MCGAVKAARGMKEVTMSPRTKTATVVASMAAGLLAIGAAVAVPGHLSHRGGGFGEIGFGGGIGRALASLDLTEDQKTQVKAILKDEQPKLDPLVDELLRSKRALFDSVHARTFDEKTVRAAASDSVKAQADLAVEKARMMSRFRGLLTDEQQDRLDAIRQRFEDRMQKRVGLARTIWREHASDFVDAL
jgi:Spy/CpxP family protein refolding chaperone